MKYLLSMLTIFAVFNTAHAFDYKSPEGQALRKKLEASQAMAKKYQAISNDVSKSGEVSPENMQDMMHVFEGMMDSYGVTSPYLADAQKITASSKEYNACVDKAEGAGTSEAIMNYMLQPNSMDFVKRALDGAKRYCEANLRDQAQTYLDRNMDNFIQRKFPRQFSTLKRCEQLSSYQTAKQHPCDV